MDTINVVVRVRPLNERERVSGATATWRVMNSTIGLVQNARVVPSCVFSFDRIFDGESRNQDIYDSVAAQIVTSALEGINGTIFTYGQTSSGKTFTMTGAPGVPGIVQLTTRDIFSAIGKAAAARHYTVRASYMEIYNENIRDLLAPGNDNLKIKENTNRDIFVGGLSEHIVRSASEVANLLARGEEGRHFGVTNMNERSSRSHTIFRLIIESRDGADEGAPGRQASLNLVDLAGSERVRQTGAEGARLKEGGHINRSLLTLTTVIGKLSESNDRAHIPFRDSKLTRILQPSLGGNARTAIIATVTPASDFADETISTLKFASRAKEVKNRPEVNEMTASDAVLLARAQQELADARRELAALRTEAAAAAAAAAEEEEQGRSLESSSGLIRPHSESDAEHNAARPAKRVRVDASVLVRMQCEVTSAEERLAAANAQLLAKTDECAALLADFEAAEERAAAADADADAAMALANEAQAAARAASEAREEADRARAAAEAAMEEARARAAAMEARAAESDEDAMRARDDAEQARSAVADAVAACQRVEAERALLDEQLGAMTASRDAAIARAEAAEADASAARALADEQAARDAAALDECRSALMDAQLAADAHGSRVIELEAELASVRAMLAETEAARVLLQERAASEAADGESARAALAETRELLANAERELSATKQALEAETAAHGEAQIALAEQTDAAERARTQLAETAAQLSGAQLELAETRETLEGVRGALGMAEADLNVAKEVAARVPLLEAQVSGYALDLEQERQSYAVARHEADEAQAQLSELQERLQGSERAGEALRGRVEELQAELCAVRVDLASAAATAARVEDAETAREVSEQRCRALETAVAAARTVLVESAAAMTSGAPTLFGRVDAEHGTRLDAAIAAQWSRCGALQTHVAALEKELAELASETQRAVASETAAHERVKVVEWALAQSAAVARGLAVGLRGELAAAGGAVAAMRTGTRQVLMDVAHVIRGAAERAAAADVRHEEALAAGRDAADRCDALALQLEEERAHAQRLSDEAIELRACSEAASSKAARLEAAAEERERHMQGLVAMSGMLQDHNSALKQQLIALRQQVASGGAARDLVAECDDVLSAPMPRAPLGEAGATAGNTATVPQRVVPQKVLSLRDRLERIERQERLMGVSDKEEENAQAENCNQQ